MATRTLLAALRRVAGPAPGPQTARRSSYLHRPRPDPSPEFEAFENPPEWRHVERLLRPRTVPEPVPRDARPSGWRPPGGGAAAPYRVERNKNHMLPLRARARPRSAERTTTISLVSGDARALRRDVEEHLAGLRGGRVAVRLHEPCRRVEVKGDFRRDLEAFLLSKGF